MLSQVGVYARDTRLLELARKFAYPPFGLPLLGIFAPDSLVLVDGTHSDNDFCPYRNEDFFEESTVLPNDRLRNGHDHVLSSPVNEVT